MYATDPLGIVGAPHETLRALKNSVADHPLDHAQLILITDRQDERRTARYGVLLHTPQTSWLTVPAFGSQFGPEGSVALAELVRWLMELGVTNVKETVTPTTEFNRVLREPDESEIRALVAAANPSDPNIYLR